MSLPTSSDVHVNRPLTNIAVAHMQREAAFGAARVFPRVPVEKQSDSYFIWNKADFNRDDAGLRGPGAEAPITAARLSTDSYTAKVYAVAKMVSDQERANQDQPLDLDRTATEVVSQKLMIRREKHWVTKAFAASVWTGSTTAADLVGTVDFTQWNDYAGSNPVQDIRTQVFHMARIPGILPQNMKLILGPKVFQQLLDHPKLLERYENVQASILNEDLLARVFGVGEVIVPYSSETTSAEGATSETFDFTHGKHALLIYVAPSPGINVPSAGYMFQWRGLLGAEGGMRIKRFRREEREADQIEGQTAEDFKVVSSILGVFFQNAVA